MMDLNDPVGILRRAQELVDEAGVADDLRPAAFTAAIEMVSRRLSPATEAPGARAAQSSGLGTAGDSALAKIAQGLGVDEETLAYIYEEDAGDLRLVVRRSLLPNPDSRAAAMRDVAQIVMAGRQLGGIADWTTYEKLRAEAEELGVLDRANFATEIQTLDIRVQGGRRTREARLTRHGLDAAIALIRRIIEGTAS
jgi:hypothetical protein